MVDYPRDKQEAYAFSKYGRTLNCVYEVYEVQENPDGTSPVDLKEAKEVNPSTEEEEVKHLERVTQVVAELRDARQNSAQNAPVRDLAVIRVPYCDVELVELKTGEDGEAATNTLSAEQWFVSSFQKDFIETYAAYYCNYCNFKNSIEINQLMPEKQIMLELKRLKQERASFDLWRQDREATIAEIEGQVLTEGQKEQMTPEQIEEFENQKNESIVALKEELERQVENDKLSQDRIKELRLLACRSLDDERDANYFGDSIYNNDFIEHSEVKNQVSSVLSAVVSQIEGENTLSKLGSGSVASPSRVADSTEADSLADLFVNCKREIEYDNGLVERPTIEGDDEFEFERIKGILPAHVEVFDTVDTSNQPITLLPAGMVEDHMNHAVLIAEREKEAARNLVLPGKSRYMMPQVPQKSKRLRNYENPQFYPFSTLPIEDAERTMQLKQLQRLIKAEKIDEGLQHKDKLAKNKVFERKYDQYFAKDNMSQVLQEAMLMEPDVATNYYTRTDQLLLVLHNKINNNKRSSDNPEKAHAIKSWKPEFRVLPNFTTWMKQYSKHIQPVPEFVPKDNFDAQVKFTFDPAALPTDMYDIDFNSIQNLNHTTHQYLPDDNSIMNTEVYEIGGKTYRRSVVYKDKFTFGFSDKLENNYLPIPEQYGLVSFQSVGKKEFWLNFSDHGSRMLIETVKAERNKQKVIEIIPPEPTPEEIAAKEEALKAAQAAAAKSKKGQPVAEPVEDKPPAPVFKELEPNFLDSLYNDKELGDATVGPCINTIMKNGLIVRHMPNGDIVQVIESSLQSNSTHRERDRVYLQNGVVVRHFENLDCQVLFPNGDVSKFSREEMRWEITNENGYRREFKDGVYKQLPRINCLSQTDPNTGIVTKLREDNVVFITYKEGNRYCQHADGTQIFSQEEGHQIRIEKDGFAPVMHQMTENPEDSEEMMEVEDLKSLNGYMTLVYLPDGCVVKSIKFYKSSDDKKNIIFKHIFQREDYSCVIVDGDGDFRIISVNARSAINEEEERARLGIDSEYLKQMYKPNGQYTPSVYYGSMNANEDEINISVKDFDRPFIYKLFGKQILRKEKLENWVRNTDFDTRQPPMQFEPERDIESIGMCKNPYIKNFLFPRIFVLNPEGDGVELLSQEQVDQVVKYTQNKDDVLQSQRVEYVDNTQLNSMQIMNKVTTLAENQIHNQKMSKLQFPEYAMPYVIFRRDEKELEKMKPSQDIYRITNISEYTSFEPLKQNAFIEDYIRFTEWKTAQVRYETEFGIVHHPPKDGSVDMDAIEDEEFYSKRINLKIYKERSLMKPEFDRNKLKENFKNSYNTDEEMINFRKKMTNVENEEKEIIAYKKQQLQTEAAKIKLLEEGEFDKKKGVSRQEKKQRTRVKVEKRLEEYRLKKETMLFSSHYHLSKSGIDYYKKNNIQPPSEEILMRMNQRIGRSQKEREEGVNQDTNMDIDENQEKQQNNDNPIVPLEPEENLNQASINKSKPLHMTQQQEMSKEDIDQNEMSLYRQEQQYLKQLGQEKILKAEEHHVIKTKDFDVYGKLRTDKPFVKSTQKSQIQSELNEKFITTECITDRRVKISSMANRQYINAPSVEEVRKQGQHQMILQAINKKQTFSELINQANSMVTSVLHDNLKRCINVLPSVCKFGTVTLGSESEMFVTLKNEDSLSQRIQIKPTQDKRIVVKQETYGPIAPGMTKRLIITIRLGENDEGSSKIKEDIQIMTKSDIFKVLVEAKIVTLDEFNQTKTTMNSRVRNRLTDSINMSKSGVMARYRDEMEQTEQNQPKQANQNQGSNSNALSDKGNELINTQENFSEMDQV